MRERFGSPGFGQLIEEIHAKRITGDGVILWGDSGVVVSQERALRNLTSTAIPDGGGGVIVKYFSESNWPGGRLQRVDGDGMIRWIDGGVESVFGQMVSDGAGGAIVGWAKEMQRYDPLGQLLWGDSGIVFNQDVGDVIPQSFIEGDYQGSVFFAWKDDKTGTFEKYSQKIDSSGTLMWGDGGVLGGGNPVRSDGEGGINYVVFDSDSIKNAIFSSRWIDSETMSGVIVVPCLKMNRRYCRGLVL